MSRSVALPLMLSLGLAALPACLGDSSHTQTPPGEDPGTDPGTPPVDPPVTEEVDAGEPPPAAFQPLSPEAYSAKVKGLLTGLPVTDAELTAVRANPNALKGLIDGWLATPQAQTKLIAFFGNAFQQTQFVQEDLLDMIGSSGLRANGNVARPLLENLRQSMARTVLDQISRGEPFNRAITTRSFMMTPAMMSLLALIDVREISDLGGVNDTMFTANKAWSYTVTSSADGGTVIPASESINPASANFMKWSVPTAFPDCPTVPVRTYGPNRDLSLELFNLLSGTVAGTTTPTTCRGMGVPAQFLPEDFTTWKRVTVRAPRTGELTTRFYDLPALRAANELVLNVPRVGYFTTPAFFANWRTNAANLARVSTNQTVIVALGQSFDPSTLTIPVSESGLDDDHANPTTSCYGCHRSLDPMRQFFRKGYTLNSHQQKDATQLAVTPSFGFAGVTATGSTVDDFAKILAEHPRFPIAWTQKLCFYVNSVGCQEADPEFARVVDAFKSSNLSFKVLVRELLSSPLVTGTAETKTFAEAGPAPSISRLDHFCSALSNRLGVTDVCRATAALGVLANNIPADGYSRGAESPVLNSDPSLFFRSAAENLCRGVADRVVDVTGSKYSSTKKDAAVADLVANLMGLPSSDPRAAVAKQILNEHYDAAVKAGGKPTDALRSTFTLACTSPTVLSVGL